MTSTAPARERVLMEGSEALARASIAAGWDLLPAGEHPAWERSAAHA